MRINRTVTNTETSGAGRRWPRVVALCCLLLLSGAATVQAAPPGLTVASAVTVPEDASTNLTFTVSDADSPLFTVFVTARSSNTNLIAGSGLVFSGFGASRLLAITPKPHRYGSATITLIATDDHGETSTNTLALTVPFVNMRPAFTSSIADKTIREDSGATNFSFTVSDYETAAASLTVAATSTNTTLVPNVNLVTGGSGTNRTLTVTPAANQNGTTLIRVVVTDGHSGTATNEFLLVVLPVNDAPTFALGTNRLVVAEDAGLVTVSNFLSGISVGPSDESSQSNWVVVSYAPTNFYAQAPAIDTNGCLTLQVTTNRFGTNVIGVRVFDNGGAANGGVSVFSNYVTLAVAAVNDAPRFTNTISDKTINEDAGRTNLTFAITDVDSSLGSLTIAVTSTNQSLVANTNLVVTGTNSSRTLSVTTLTNAVGATEITVIVSDPLGGTDTNTFVLTVSAVNDMPRLSAFAATNVLEDSSETTIAFTVSDVDTALSNVTTSVSYVATNLVSLTITNVDDTNRVLVITPLTNGFGSATIAVIADDGSKSSTNAFTLTVTPVNDPPLFTLSTNLLAVAEDAGRLTVTNFLTGLAAGPTNETGQSWTFTVSSTTNFAYASAPALATNGNLTFQAATNANGSNLLTVVMRDSGGATNGGVNATTNTFSLVLSAGDDPPAIAGATNRTVLEDATSGLTADLTISDIDSDPTNFTVTASSANTNLVCVAVAGSNAAWTLTFTLKTNATGATTITVIADDGEKFRTNAFTLTVTPVNDPPLFTLSTNLLAVAEDAGRLTVTNFLTGLAAGPTNEAGQSWTFTLTSSTNFAYASAPALATNGHLTFQAATNANGSNLLTVVMRDSGGTTNGGVNAITNTFSLIVSAGDDPPAIAGATNRTVLEDATSGLTADLTISDIDSDPTNFTVTASSANTNLACVAVAGSNAAWTLTFTLKTNATGATTITVIADDAEKFRTNAFTLTVTPVNDPPLFTLSTNLLAVAEDAGRLTVTNFLTGLAAGPTNETGQSWTFTVSSTTNFAYASAPALATNGHLTFQAATNANGSNLLTVVMRDSGGTTNGGVNATTNTFSLVLSAGDDPPAIAGATNRTVLEDATSGLTADLTISDIDSDPTNFTVTASSANTNLACVAVAGSNAAWTLTFTLKTNATGATTITVIADDAEKFRTNAFTLTVTAVNDPPLFTLSTNLLAVAEDAGRLTVTNFLTGLAAGPTNEAGQSWTFTLTSSTNFAYASAPALATNGHLTFQAATNANGSNLLTVVMRDSGGTTNGGVNAITNTFSLIVSAGDDPPAIAGATNRTVLEDATSGLTADLTISDIDSDPTNFTVTASSANTNLACVAVAGSNAAWTLTFTLKTNATGATTITVIADDAEKFRTNAFTLTVTPVNDPPLFTLSTNLLAVAEDAGRLTVTNFLTGLAAGPTNETGQSWTFTVSSTTNFAYASAPALATNGHLTFQAATNANGSNLLTVVMRDSGGTTNGGVNATTNTFSLVLSAGDDPPAIAGATNRTVLEDATSGLTADLTISDIDSDPTNFTVTASSANTNLACVAVAGSNAAWTLTFTLKTNATGATTITVIADDAEKFRTNAFTLTVTAVNDPPLFTLSTNLLAVAEDAGRLTVTNFLTGLAAGPTNEAGQSWTFTLTSSTNFAYASAPALATNGHLTFQAATNANGSNLLTVVMRDSGGTTNGGVNAITNTFSLIVSAGDDPPAIAGATNRTVLEDATSGLTADLTISDIDSDPTNFTVTASSANTNLACVAVAGSNAAWTLTFTLKTNATGATTITVIADDAEKFRTNAFTLTVTPVNDPPLFTLSTNLLAVAEDAGRLTVTNFLTGLAAGPTNETGQSWTFTVSSTTNFAYASAPALATNGHLTFQAATNANGSNLLTVVMRDSGGTTNGGVNATTNTFSLVLSAGDDPPAIAGATNRTVLEDATSGLTADLTISDIDSDPTNFTVTASSANTNLACVAVAGSNAAWTLTFTLKTNATGATTITVIADDAEKFRTNAFTLTVTAVNDPPLFTLSTNLLAVAEDAGRLTVTNFLTGLAAGPTNEAGQSWTFTLTSSTNFAYASAPALATNGHLTFQAATNANGSNLLTVVMRDSGGTTNGGINATTNTFSLIVSAGDDPPAIAGATNRTVLEDATSGLTADLTISDIDSDPTNFTVTASSANTNLVCVAVAGSNAAWTLTFTLKTNATGATTITVIADDAEKFRTNAFTLTVTPVNDPPLFTLSTNLLAVAEDAGRLTVTNFLTGLAAGPTNETGQSWTFTVSSTTNFAYASAPALATNGHLTFQAATNANGSNLLTVVMRDSGGATNGGINATTNTFSLIVSAGDDPPAIAGATNRTVLEDATSGLTADLTISDIDSDPTNFTVTASSANTNLACVAVAGSNAAWTLTFTLKTNATGATTITVIADDAEKFRTNAFTLTVTPVNDPPLFTLSTNLLAVAEDAGRLTVTNFLTGLAAGPTNEAGQSWTFTLTSSTNFAYASAPVLATNGHLTFQAATNANGSNLLTVVMRDSGGTTNGGINATTNTFSLVVSAANDLPIITGLSSNLTNREDISTNYTIAVSDVESAITNVTVTAESSDTNLVEVSVSGTGTNRTLALTLRTNAYGTAILTLVAGDETESATNTYNLTVLSVNDVPSFNLAISSVTVDQYAVAVSVASVVTNLSVGPENESNQVASLVVSNSNSGLFLVQPAITTNGTLTFTPGGTGGSVTVTVRAQDNGGTANGGVATSAAQTFDVEIPANPFPYLAGRFSGLFYETNELSHESSGYFSFVLGTNGTFSGYVLRVGTSNQFNGQFGVSNANASAAVSNTSLTLELTLDTSEDWTESVSGTVTNSGSWSAPLLGYLLVYSSAFLTDLAGEYLVAIPGFADAADGPAGDATLSLIVSTNGTTSLGGYLADDFPATQRSHISRLGQFPLYAPLYSSGVNGSLSGWLTFSGGGASAFTDDSQVLWVKKSGGSLYTSGFTNQSVAVGSFYDSNVVSLLSITSGEVILSGGNLTTPITNAVTISHNTITVDPAATNQLVLSFDRANGEILGGFVAPGGRSNTIYSVILQSTNEARGYFLGTSQGGSFILR